MSEDFDVEFFSASPDEPIKWVAHPQGEGVALSIWEDSLNEPLFYMMERHMVSGLADFFAVWLEDTRLEKILGMEEADMPDDGFEVWLRQGIANNYCSEQYCNSHDLGPLHESEWEALDEGWEPCNHVVRLGSYDDWDVSSMLEEE